MKKVLLLAAIAVFGLTSVNAQDTQFGVKAGIDIMSQTVAGFSVSSTNVYFGGFAEIELDSFTLQPEVIYVAATGGGLVHVPVMAKFNLSDEFNLLAGPALGFLTNSGGGKSFNYGIEAGVAYDISEALFLEARYSLGLADFAPDGAGFTSKLNGFFIGAGYRL
ncbi:hypothetical protein [uncultured Algibacter sp.]|uniref:hypothetical protein n=1 Tax=uncultured Algibacter sp. TaxID=298659 RepID=UPI00260D35EE|nr:hypothetical protein [uncultured Algibacter sp.]